MSDKRSKAENRTNPSSFIPHPSSLVPHPLRLILASGSPRRRELLTEAGYEFDIVVPSETAECGLCSRESPKEFVARLARQKAADVIGRIDHGLVVACDTVAECNGQILGKPANEDHARRMLQNAQRSRAPRAVRTLPVASGREQGAGSREQPETYILPAPGSLLHATRPRGSDETADGPFDAGTD